MEKYKPELKEKYRNLWNMCRTEQKNLQKPRLVSVPSKIMKERSTMNWSHREKRRRLAKWRPIVLVGSPKKSI
jgi:hypothetical protein